MSSRQKTGQQGEDLAVSFLQRNGYDIVSRNWRCSAGELDIVAQQGSQLIFVEVRTRRGTRFGTAAESVTTTKQARLIDLAQTYLQEMTIPDDQAWQIDVITVQLQEGQAPEINHIANAVGW